MTCKSCSVFQTKKNVTIDTSACLFRNITELFSEVKCMKSCVNISTVSDGQTLNIYLKQIETKINIFNL